MNFAGLEGRFSDSARSPFVVVPVPYEKTTTYKKGTKHAPGKIIEASQQLPLFDIETEINPAEKGIATLPSVVAEDFYSLRRKLTPLAKKIFRDGRFPVFIGGEHTITVAVAEAFEKDVSVLQLDAHPDLFSTFEGEKYNHACTMARIRELGFDVVQLGIRAVCEMEREAYYEHRDFIITAEEYFNDKKKAVDRVLSLLGKKVYISVDLDVFDISFFPAVGNPEPGGFFWEDVLAIVKAVIKEKDVVGMDVVELLPFEGSYPYDYTAASLIYKAFAYLSAYKLL